MSFPFDLLCFDPFLRTQKRKKRFFFLFFFFLLKKEQISFGNLCSRSVNLPSKAATRVGCV